MAFLAPARSCKLRTAGSHYLQVSGEPLLSANLGYYDILGLMGQFVFKKTV